MSNLESRLDEEVHSYLQIVETKEEVKELQSGNVTLTVYRKFLMTFYIIEYISQKAVKKASENTAQENPYLSKRFDLCAKGELGHADIALKDLSDMGEKDFELNNKQLVDEYDNFLQNEADEFPLGILGHSYLFENVSGLLFPKNKPLKYPSKFIEVHAKEDPGHSQAIKKTVRNIEAGITEDDIEKIIVFSRKSGKYLLKLFDTV
ncbi:MAG: hypothetical protein ACR2NW_00385 [Thermodesulfobacteriota bacterium]